MWHHSGRKGSRGKSSAEACSRLLRYTHPLTFDRTRGILLVQTPDPLPVEVLSHRFHTTIVRAVLQDSRLGLGELGISAIWERDTRPPRAIRKKQQKKKRARSKTKHALGD